jgi:hypothetical protein
MVRDITALARHSEITERTARALLKMKEAAAVGGLSVIGETALAGFDRSCPNLIGRGSSFHISNRN